MPVTIVSTRIKSAGANNQPVQNARRETINLTGVIAAADTGTYVPTGRPILNAANIPAIIGLPSMIAPTYNTLTNTITFTSSAVFAALNQFVDILLEK